MFQISLFFLVSHILKILTYYIITITINYQLNSYSISLYIVRCLYCSAFNFIAVIDTEVKFRQIINYYESIISSVNIVNAIDIIILLIIITTYKVLSFYIYLYCIK